MLVLAAGCVGQPPAPGPQGPAPGSVAAMLGDPRTVDPCTLTDPAALKATPAATVSLDYCLLHVQLDDGSLAQLAVGELVPAAPGPADAATEDEDPVVPRGSLRLVQEAPLPGHCTRRIRFDDGTAMQVSADLLTGDPAAGLCAVAEAGADTAIAAMEQHRVGHRQYPPNSLALTDPCAVLDSAVVHQIPGLEQAQPQSAPAGHQCQWGEQDAQAPRVSFTHTAGKPPAVLHGAAVEEEIAGRRTVVSVVGGDPSVPLCSAETGHIPFGGPGEVEVAMLVVAFPGATGIEACEFARGLAREAWPRLPAH
ncbi:hypothetical protein GCM10010470_09960 [Saccharopolyspora taberi]|uniref:DUF3558 domain-containing protein n=1 Tax=Saccharopolyspora taberi TaxID=60895 RepID=A0ABN3V8P3_9PSEU